MSDFDIKIFADDLEEEAQMQLAKLISVPAFVNKKIRIMPDAHAGAGCVIGFTGNLGSKIIPNIVGVDIGCGMLTVDITEAIMHVGYDPKRFEEIINTYIPSGRNIRAQKVDNTEIIDQLYCIDKLRNIDLLKSSLGTLGGGNHFIEIDKSETSGRYFLVIHSGSRNLGYQVAKYYQNLAIERCQKDPLNNQLKKLIEDYKKAGREIEIQDAILTLKNGYNVIPAELCYLEGKDCDDYLHDMELCVQWARENRLLMANIILCAYLGKKPTYNFLTDGFSELCIYDIKGFKKALTFNYFETIHNYIDSRDHIVRKGAVSAYYGEKILIPLNMRDGSIIGIGKGNPDWNYSAPHGAGRKMSRHQARQNIKLEDFKKEMEGIDTFSVDESTLDEAPDAYKDSQTIIRDIEPTVAIFDIIKPLYNFKAKEKNKEVVE